MRKGKLTESFPLSLTSWQREELRKVADERGISCSKLIRVALGKYLAEPVPSIPCPQDRDENRVVLHV